VIEDFQFGEEFGQLSGLEQVVGIARAGFECALIVGEGFVDQQAAGCEYAQDRGNQRAMQVAKDQNGSTTITSKWNLSRILEVCEERFECERRLRGFVKFCEEASIAVDSDDRNAGFSRGECVASATAGEVGNRAQLRRGPDSVELIIEEFGRR